MSASRSVSSRPALYASPDLCDTPTDVGPAFTFLYVLECHVYSPVRTNPAMAVITMAATTNGTDAKTNPTHAVANATGNNNFDIMLSP
jgi:hypothetical protein